jgi:hypothetical protein
MTELGQPSRTEISRRAYALYLLRGCEGGKDVEDWLTAEKELSDESTASKAKAKIARAGPAANKKAVQFEAKKANVKGTLDSKTKLIYVRAVDAAT